MARALSTKTQLNQVLFNTRFEPFLVTGGLFAFTTLYFTRVLPLQVIGFFLLAFVSIYLSIAVRYISPMSLKDFKLTWDKMGRYITMAAVLALFGWVFFRSYVIISRGNALSLGYGGSFVPILSILAVASAEEIFFRGYLQNRLGLNYPMWKRVLITVVALALYKNVLHLWYGYPLLEHVELFLLGFLLSVFPSLWMEQSRSLVGPLFLHIFWDLLVYAPLGEIPYWVI